MKRKNYRIAYSQLISADGGSASVSAHSDFRLHRASITVAENENGINSQLQQPKIHELVLTCIGRFSRIVLSILLSVNISAIFL